MMSLIFKVPCLILILGLEAVNVYLIVRIKVKN